METTRIRHLLPLAALLLAGCDIMGPKACPAIVRPAVVVEIRDATTEAYVAADARGVVKDGEYQDSLRAHGFTSGDTMTSRQAAFGRPGTYTVVVAHPEYELWVREGVRAEKGECTVKTRTLQARLTPAGGTGGGAADAGPLEVRP